MSAERVRELVHLKDVNALRIALRFYRAFRKRCRVQETGTCLSLLQGIQTIFTKIPSFSESN